MEECSRQLCWLRRQSGLDRLWGSQTHSLQIARIRRSHFSAPSRTYNRAQSTDTAPQWRRSSSNFSASTPGTGCFRTVSTTPRRPQEEWVPCNWLYRVYPPTDPHTGGTTWRCPWGPPSVRQTYHSWPLVEA